MPTQIKTAGISYPDHCAQIVPVKVKLLKSTLRKLQDMFCLVAVLRARVRNSADFILTR